MEDPTFSTRNNNIIYARMCFYKRCQDSNETFFEFLDHVRDLAKSCEFHNEEDSMIRDRIVFGVEDGAIREKFIINGGNPSLQQVIQFCLEFGLHEEDMACQNMSLLGESEMKTIGFDDVLHSGIDHDVHIQYEMQLDTHHDSFQDDLNIEDDHLSLQECSICQKIFTSKSCLRRHLEIHEVFDAFRVSDDEKVQCGQCDKSFLRPYELKRHSLSHSQTNREFQCDVCEKSFKLKSHLKRHILVHAKYNFGFQRPTQFECYICKRVLKMRRTLRAHLKYHHNGKMALCNVCGVRFKNQAMLRSHITIHTGEKPYSCKYCERQFRRKDDVTSHMIQHTGIRPFKCDECGKTYGTRYKLKLHMWTHGEKKPFECGICRRGFIQSADLDKHMRCHSAHKHFKCNICEKEYRCRESLKKHLSSSHQSV